METWTTTIVGGAIAALLSAGIGWLLKRPRLDVTVPHPPDPLFPETASQIEIDLRARNTDMSITSMVLEVEGQDAQMLFPLSIGTETVRPPIPVQKGTHVTVQADLSIALKSLKHPRGDNRARVVVRASDHNLRKKSDPFFL